MRSGPSFVESVYFSSRNLSNLIKVALKREKWSVRVRPNCETYSPSFAVQNCISLKYNFEVVKEKVDHFDQLFTFGLDTYFSLKSLERSGRFGFRNRIVAK